MQATPDAMSASGPASSTSTVERFGDPRDPKVDAVDRG
jgi:hypothetical protein